MKLAARSLSLLLTLAVALGAAPSALAMAERPEAAPSPEAASAETLHWQGHLKLPHGELLMVVRLVRQADGSLKGWLDVPGQGAKNLPLEEVAMGQGVLRFKVKGIGAGYEGALDADGRKAAGTWSQGGASLSLALERTDAAFELVRPQTPKPPFPYLAQEVRYTNSVDGTRLAGTLSRPQGQGPFPAVLLITGSGAQDRDETILGHKPFLLIADHLSRRGFAVLRVDDRGVGGSTGNPETSSTRDFATDVEAGFDFLRRQAGIDPKRVGLLGHSEGGVIAPMVAAKRPEVAFVVLLAGSGMRGDQMVNEQIRVIQRHQGKPAAETERVLKLQEQLYAVLRTHKDPAVAAPKLRALLAPELEQVAPQSIEPQVKALNSPWFRTFIDLDPAPYLAKVKVPVLAINGEKDTQVIAGPNLAAIERAVKSNGNRDVTTRAIPGANHLFQPATTGMVDEYGQIETTMKPEALDTISTWLTQRFVKP